MTPIARRYLGNLGRHDIDVSQASGPQCRNPIDHDTKVSRSDGEGFARQQHNGTVRRYRDRSQERRPANHSFAACHADLSPNTIAHIGGQRDDPGFDEINIIKRATAVINNLPPDECLWPERHRERVRRFLADA